MRRLSSIPRALLPARFDENGEPTGLNKLITNGLLYLSRRSCANPIYSIIAVYAIASIFYLRLLDTSLFRDVGRNPSDSVHVDSGSLLQTAKNLRLGEQTAWRWQPVGADEAQNAAQHLALSTLIFPSTFSSSSKLAPLAETVPVPSNITANSIPTTPNLLSPISQDSSLAFSLPFQDVQYFLDSVREIPDRSDVITEHNTKVWNLKTARYSASNAPRSLRVWLRDAWVSFVDLIKHAETLDICVVSSGYLAMHLTFISLFLSMRRLGSNVWLAVCTLFSGLFAFLFGLLVTTKMGVPINIVLLSEGLPFLVVTIGFEKSIVLTKAVLTASSQPRRTAPSTRGSNGHLRATVRAPAPAPTIQDAILAAVREKGFEIVRDYFIEIAILLAGACSGVQGGLSQFCLLAAWILFFDLVLLFVFYTPILCTKLEITSFRRHIALRGALEDDGMRRNVAERVAASNNAWPSSAAIDSANGKTLDRSLPGRLLGINSIPKLKFVVFGGFIAINFLQLVGIPFKNTGKTNALLTTSYSNVLGLTPIDPFKVAENGLDSIYVTAKSQKLETVVTVLPPVKYALESPSVFAGQPTGEAAILDDDYADIFLGVVSGRVIGSILKSFEDPMLTKWIILALTLSVTLNYYLLQMTRGSIKHVEPVQRIIPEAAPSDPEPGVDSGEDHPRRSQEECETFVRERRAAYLNDEELVELALRGRIPGHALEKSMDAPELMSQVASYTRAVKIRRSLVSRTRSTADKTYLLESSKTPYRDFNYGLVHGVCCENVIGYLPLPLGVAGPLSIDGESYFLPMATTEGVLVASISRGCKALNAGGGATTVLTADGMTRGPCVGFPTAARAADAKNWMDSDEGQRVVKDAFNSTSRYARLQSTKSAQAGSYLYIRFKTTTGDAMGMNMISKGVEKTLSVMKEEGFGDMAIITISGNYCTDKKPAAVNWIDGRGKSVVAEAIIPADAVRSILKSDVNALVELNVSKNLIGSAMAGSTGGFNAHASNIITAMFLATGQDPAQNVESSNCITIMKNTNGNLQISVSMPSIEVGTVGGGTILEAQSAMLDLLGVRGPHPTDPGANARQLARIMAAAVLAGELSLCSALAAGHLVSAHMAHNRSAVPTRATTPVSAAVDAQSRSVRNMNGNAVTPRSDNLRMTPAQ
ncbi:MAG: hypothetical protein Q9227_000074 [Pyrenula ochraceoflavens]